MAEQSHANAVAMEEAKALPPLYRFPVACEMIPLRNMGCLYQAISRHGIQPLYMKNRGHKEGFLTLAQIVELRNRMFTSVHHMRSKNGTRAKRSGPIAAIMRRAMTG